MENLFAWLRECRGLVFVTFLSIKHTVQRHGVDDMTGRDIAGELAHMTEVFEHVNRIAAAVLAEDMASEVRLRLHRWTEYFGWPQGMDALIEQTESDGIHDLEDRMTEAARNGDWNDLIEEASNHPASPFIRS
ncbi:hypothetical protein [Agrobacterium pusense]|uniref:hypothetical protein n=1 Tax=Agrobacterium pusense TaxID=648995 RepID=UPI001AE12232|nr:hypothetical protein [Agrobacterium pusense]MBP2611449.1 hypothetical protein [Agrobacterium pusense]